MVARKMTIEELNSLRGVEPSITAYKKMTEDELKKLRDESLLKATKEPLANASRLSLSIPVPPVSYVNKNAAVNPKVETKFPEGQNNLFPAIAVFKEQYNKNAAPIGPAGPPLPILYPNKNVGFAMPNNQKISVNQPEIKQMTPEIKKEYEERLLKSGNRIAPINFLNNIEPQTFIDNQNLPNNRKNPSNQSDISEMSPELKNKLDKRHEEWEVTPFANMADIDIALKVGKMKEKDFDKYTPYVQQQLEVIYDKEKKYSDAFMNSSVRPTITDNFGDYIKRIELSRIQPTIQSLKYLPIKVYAGAIGGVEDAYDYTITAASWLVGNVADAGGNFRNPVSKKLKEIAANQLKKKDIGTYISEYADKNAHAVPEEVRSFVGSVFESAGRMLPSIAMELATGGAAPTAMDVQAAKAGKLLFDGAKDFFKPSKAVFGLSAAGGSASQGYEISGDLEKSLAYGAMSGLGEMASEMIFGGFAGTDIGDSLIDFNIKNNVVRKLVNFGTEAVEEMIMEAVDPFLRRLTVEPEAAFASLEDYGGAALSGIMLSVIMGGATFPIQHNASSQLRKEFALTLNSHAAVLNELLPERNPIRPLDINKATAEDIQNQQKIIGEAGLFFKDKLEKAAMEELAKKENTNPVDSIIAEFVDDAIGIITGRPKSAQPQPVPPPQPAPTVATPQLPITGAQNPTPNAPPPPPQKSVAPKSEFDELKQEAELMRQDNATQPINDAIPLPPPQPKNENNIPKPLENIPKSDITRVCHLVEPKTSNT